MSESAGRSPLRSNSRGKKTLFGVALLGMASWRSIALGVVALLAIIGCLLQFTVWSKPNPLQLFAQAKVALANRDYRSARDLASQIPQESSRWIEAQLIAGEACTRLEDFPAAISFYRAVPEDDSPQSIAAAMSLGELYRSMGQLTPAEKQYRYVLEHNAAYPGIHERMAHLLALTRRLWEARDHFMNLVRQGNWDLQSLAILGDLERPLEHPAFLKQALLDYPDDTLVQLGNAANALYLEGHVSTAQPLLRKLAAESPDLIPAQAMLGETLVSADDSEFVRWHSQLPAEAIDSPEIWFVKGLWARQREKLPLAARCFWETVRREPTHRRANYQLSMVLKKLDHPASEEFTRLAEIQAELGQHLDDVLKDEGKNETALKQIVEIMEQSGRIWEAAAWAETTIRYYPNAEWPRTVTARFTSLLTLASPQVLDAKNLSLKYNLSDYPQFDELLKQSLPQSSPMGPLPVTAAIRFEVADLGVDFTYFNGDDPSTPGVRMFEQSGGGVAVLDLDGDHWPDLYLTQGAEWIQGEKQPIESPASADRIYRNLEGNAFEDVTEASGLGNVGFGQGATVGDFNGDGLPDLYVANVGRNRLYENNGDGTFTDVTTESGIALEDWTTSCLMIDLNADGLPDVYDVNYLTGPDVYAIICQKIGCSPSVFEGLPDRVHFNLGDGRFHTLLTATPQVNAKGLGVLAFDLDEPGLPCLFIANDQVPNFLLRCRRTQDYTNLQLENLAFLSGVAYNMDGLAMACMGIAADDLNGDGRVDLFVTNFKTESNTLYMQDADGLFNDRTNLSGLVSPSLPMTGWGTQFLDANLDGESDLLVANGHVYPSEKDEYAMRPQFFQNLGDIRFKEILTPELGEYFQQKHVGRALARLDWNRDGQMDFVVSHIMEPVAILQNVTETTGRFLAVRLHATSTAREGIGSVVEVQVGNRTWKKQLMAGDGFQACNERLLHFGLGETDLIPTVTVTWPSGNTTTIENVATNGVLDLVEESSLGTYYRNHQLTSLPVTPATRTAPSPE